MYNKTKRALFLMTILGLSTGARAQLVSVVNTSATESTSEPSFCHKVGNFLFERVQNPWELFRQVSAASVVEIALGDLVEAIKYDEAAKLFIRDIGLTPGIAWNTYKEEQVAGLKYRYDISHIWSIGSKIILKVGGAYYLITQGHDPKEACRKAAYLGDIVGRFFINRGRFQQDNANTTDANYDWTSGLTDATIQIVPNNVIMFFLNDWVNGYFGLTNKARQVTMVLLNLLPRFPAADISKTIPWNNWKSAPIASLILGTKLAISFAVSKAASTVTLSPIGNSIMDTIGASMKHAKTMPEQIFYGSGMDD